MSIPFSPPYIDKEVETQVLESLRSGWITTGPKVRELEGLVSENCGVEHSLCVNSATSGMMLALHWFGVGRGDEVIIPAYTYCATALVVQHLGATPVLVDVTDDFNISIERIKSATNERTKAIIPVDFAGWPCPYDEINEWASSDQVRKAFKPKHEQQEKLGRPLILSDAAHSFGAFYKGKPTGSLADISVFSFHAVKNLTTAEGGAICINLPSPFNNGEVYSTLRLWSLNGQTKDAFTKSQAGAWRYDIVYPGFKINMPDICAAIGLGQMKSYFTESLPRRNQIYDQYSASFSKYSWAITPVRKTEIAEGCGHLYPLRIRGANESMRDEIINKISSEGVAVNVHFIPLPMLTVFKDRGYDIADYPMTYSLFSNEISLPIYPQLSDEQVNRVIQTVIRSVEKVIE